MNENNFLTTFVSDYVEILTDVSLRQTIPTTDGGAQEVVTPLTVQGFVMDCDETFVYLSPDGETIDQALPLSSIKHIQVMTETAEMDQLLDDADIPDRDEGYN